MEVAVGQWTGGWCVSLGGYEVIKGAVCWEKPAVMNFS